MARTRESASSARARTDSRVCFSLIADLGDVGSGVNEPSLGGGERNDAGVVLNVYGRGHNGDQVAEVGHATHLVQTLLEGEVVGDCNLVDAFATLEESKA